MPPSVGQIVHYYPDPQDPWIRNDEPPLAALVVRVLNDHTVNLAVFHSSGQTASPRGTVRFVDSDESPPAGAGYCTWPPFHVEFPRVTTEPNGPRVRAQPFETSL